MAPHWKCGSRQRVAGSNPALSATPRDAAASRLRGGRLTHLDADWPFDQGPNVAALTLQSILDGAPILLVSHDEDDEDWQFLDGSSPAESDARVVGMRTMLELDPSLRAIADLPPGWTASRRSATDEWRRQRHA